MKKPDESVVRVAVVQSSPELFDKKKGLEKLAGQIRSLKPEKPSLILFPEALIPGYPRHLGFGAKVGHKNDAGKELFSRYYRNSVEIPSVDTEMISEAAGFTGAFTAVGLVEKHQGTLYCSLAYFAPDGGLLGVHRKLKPTGAERLIWGEGDGTSLLTFKTPFARIGGLICWENYMPLARMALYGKGVEIYLAPTADQRDSWQTTMQHIALEGRCFVLGCNQFVNREMYPSDILDDENVPGEDILSSGGSVIVSPSGEVLAGPLWNKEGILLADLHMDEVVRGKFELDVAGHYNRPDVFRFEVNGQRGTIEIPG